MSDLRKTGLSIFALWFMFCCGLQANTVTVDLSSIANGSFKSTEVANGNLFPTGQNVFNGVPFNIPSGTNNAWFGSNAGVANGTEVADIHPNIFGATTAYTLVNTMFVGETKPGAYLKFTFIGNDLNTQFTFFMTQNVDYRDYNQSTINNIGNHTTNAWNDQAIVGTTSWQRLDMQTIQLPDVFRTQILTHVIITDDGAFGVQRAIWSGLSISDATDPEPATLILFASGLALCCAWGRKRQRS